MRNSIRVTTETFFWNNMCKRPSARASERLIEAIVSRLSTKFKELGSYQPWPVSKA